MKNWTRYVPTRKNKHTVSLEEMAAKETVAPEVKRELKRRAKRNTP